MDDQQLDHAAALRGGLVAAALAALLLAGCGKTASGITLSTPAPEAPKPLSAAPVVTNAPASPTPSASARTAPTPAAPQAPATPQAAEQQVIAAYSEYHRMFRPISLMSAADRPAALARVAADPLFTAVLTELAARDRAGRVVYGQAVLHPHVSALTSDFAAIEDCQDTSQTGLQNKATGVKLTVGVTQFKRLTQLTRGPDGAWRLTNVERSVNGKC